MEWINDHIPFLGKVLTALGVGGGSGWLTKKWIDKRQNEKIQVLEDRMDSAENRIGEVEKDLEINTKFDKQFREDINKRFDRIEIKQDQILNKFIDVVKSK